MKKTSFVSALMFGLLSLAVHAEDAKISGDAVCAKCALKQVSACQMAVKVKTADGKEEIILAENNPVAKDFHSEICKATVAVNAEGVITEKDGKKTIVLTKVEAAK
jgi:hypothetical protein